LHADPTLTSTDPLDHTVEARTHAQFFAKQIGDEGRICTHAFSSKAEIFTRLIKHQELANVEYTSISGDSS
jgi:Tat protein secretion system quality control protein TatD with DNase activity